jgi:hypothetical protein
VLTAARWTSAAGAVAGLLCLLVYLATVHIDPAVAVAQPGVPYFVIGLAAGVVAAYVAWRDPEPGCLAVAAAAGLYLGLAYVSAPTLGPLVLLAALLYAVAAAGSWAGDRRSGGRLALVLLLIPAGLALGLVPLLLPH